MYVLQGIVYTTMHHSVYITMHYLIVMSIITTNAVANPRISAHASPIPSYISGNNILFSLEMCHITTARIMFFSGPVTQTFWIS